jgi:hypothetical protein
MGLPAEHIKHLKAGLAPLFLLVASDKKSNSHHHK